MADILCLKGDAAFSAFRLQGLNNRLMAAVAGIMVFISVDELLPGAEKYGEHHFSIAGFVAGMAVMAISLLML